MVVSVKQLLIVAESIQRETDIRQMAMILVHRSMAVHDEAERLDPLRSVAACGYIYGSQAKLESESVRL
jgi:hypothetical protein